jgi:arylsulfatase A-like enzyme
MNPADVILPLNVPRGGEIEAKARRELAGYYTHLAATDRCIGQLLENLGCQREDENTIVVFTSVHGDMHGAHGLFRKGWPHEESVRVPLLVRLPNQLKARDARREAGGQGDTAVSLLNLRAMTLDWASGVLPPASRPHAFISMPSVVALPHQCDRTWRGVRTPTRKLVLSTDGAPWLFFDLERDPLEMQNLAADPKRAAEIAEFARLLR